MRDFPAEKFFIESQRSAVQSGASLIGKQSRIASELLAEKAKLPVKCFGNRWEFFDGGEVPVKEATLCKLTKQTISGARPTACGRSCLRQELER